MDQTGKATLLKNGYIIDGTGTQGFRGDLLIKGDKIHSVSKTKLSAPDAITIDCKGKMVAPGFIDMHSHNDWFLTGRQHSKFTKPFTEQGITTFVGGNCGFGVAGFKNKSPFKHIIEDNLFKAGTRQLKWESMSEYINTLENQGITHNLAPLAGHGTTRVSVRGQDPSPLNQNEIKEIMGLLGQAMDDGAHGVSFGLQYSPGIFSTVDEIKKTAELVRKKGKIITVHPKACSSISGTYPLKPFGKPHNLIALEETINLARKTRVSLQFSHLIFVGEKSWKTLDRALSLIDQAIDDGVDLMFDTYAYHCGASVITVFLPDWFMAKAPQSYRDKSLLFRVRMLMAVSFRLLGFGFEDIQIAAANHPDLDQFNGMFLSDIARKRKVPPFENYMDFVRKSKGTSRVLMHKYSNPAILETLMAHRASLFMTDAWSEPVGLQNPAAFGCFPKFLQLAREKRLLSPEQAVHKMTGASAKRFNITDRGVLEKGRAADITIFDWHAIGDNTTLENTSLRPSGIDKVFINGAQVLEKGIADQDLRPGKVIV